MIFLLHICTALRYVVGDAEGFAVFHEFFFRNGIRVLEIAPQPENAVCRSCNERNERLIIFAACIDDHFTGHMQQIGIAQLLANRVGILRHVARCKRNQTRIP